VGVGASSVAAVRGILQAVHILGYTAYSNIFDARSLTANLYRHHNFSDVRVIHLPEALARDVGRTYRIDAYFEAYSPDRRTEDG